MYSARDVSPGISEGKSLQRLMRVKNGVAFAVIQVKYTRRGPLCLPLQSGLFICVISSFPSVHNGPNQGVIRY